MTFDEIKSLISEGEMLSCVAMKFNEGIRLQKNEIEKINMEVVQAEEKFHEMELAHGEKGFKITLFYFFIKNV